MAPVVLDVPPGVASRSSSGTRPALPSSAAERTGTEAGSAARVPVPAPGRYRYVKTAGNDMVTVPAGLHCHWEMNWTATTVDVATTSAGTVFDWKINDNHTERETFSYADGAVSLVGRTSSVSCATFTWGGEVTYAPPVVRFRAHLVEGATWSGSATTARGTESSSVRVHKREQVEVAAGTFDAWVIEQTTTYRGEMSGERTETFWFVPSLGLSARHAVDQLTQHDGYTFQAKYTLELEATPSTG